MFSNKSRYWVGILYSENLMDNWEFLCPDVLQVPYAYCEHNQDLDSKGETRKPHVHMILAFSNTTTERHAKYVLNLLSARGKVCCSTVQPCISVRKSFDYLIHDTETCRKLGKHLYDSGQRHIGNGFDIGVFEQLSVLERSEICKTICFAIKEYQFTNLMQVFDYVVQQPDSNYFQIFSSYSSLFERLCKANFLTGGGGVDLNLHKRIDNLCCIECGSVRVQKRGKTKTGSQRYKCLDCGKSWS